MIPINMIKEWRQHAPWVYQSQVEQDLILSRALTVLYQDELLREALAFRGGTALNKLFIEPAARYSEDLKNLPTRRTHGNKAAGIVSAIERT